MTPSGRKRFFVHCRHRGQRVWKIVGDAGTIDVAEARSLAEATLAAIRRGEPAPPRPEETLFEAVLERQPRGESPFVFPSPRDPSRPRGPGLPVWNRIRGEAGIEDVRLHDLRHTHASHAVMNGVPVPVVFRLLGHSSVGMTLRYAYLSDREIEQAAERFGRAIADIMGAGHSTVSLRCVERRIVRVTHPFHPLHGREFELVEVKPPQGVGSVHCTTREMTGFT